MGRWLAQIEKHPDMELTKLTEPSFVSFVGADSEHIPIGEGDSHPSIPNQKSICNNQDRIGSVSFASTLISTSLLLEYFFNEAIILGMKLLPDDKRWIKVICYGVPLLKLKSLLEQYTTCWLDALTNELLAHKKQNVGRFTANTFLREAFGKHPDKIRQSVLKAVK